MALLRYLGRAGLKVDREEVAQKLLELLPKEGGVLMQTMADEWIEQGKVIGLKEGRHEGEIQGRIKTLRTMILHVLQRRFPANEVLWQIFEQQLGLISDEKALNQLVDIALEVIVLPDFASKVQAFVPATKAAPDGV